jgi:hypothetical protein
MAIKGNLSSDAPYTMFGPAVGTVQGSPVYGPLASPQTQAMDALYVAVATDSTFALADQNNVATVFGVVPAGTVLQVSPCRVSAIVSGSVVPLYR